MVDKPGDGAADVPVKADSNVEVKSQTIRTTISLPSISLKKVLVSLGVIALFAVAAVPSYYFYSAYQKAQDLLKNPTKAAQVELEETISSVSKLIILPSNEKPTLATVSDVEKLRSQPFFAQAKNGDKVLIYTEAKRAILYRPADGKIVEVAPLNVSPMEAEVAGAATDSAGMVESPAAGAPNFPQRDKITPTVAPLRIAILNGTPKTGLAGTIEQILKLKVPNIQVVEKGNAKLQTYESSIVVDVKGNSRSAAEQIASIIGGQVVPLPVGETLPDADFLIIAGQK